MNGSEFLTGQKALAVCICLCFCFLNMDLCLLADRAKWSNCWKGFCWWPGCGLAQTGNMRYNRNVLCAEVTQEFEFCQNCNTWVCHLILTGVEESTAIISGHEKEQKAAFKEKGIGKTAAWLTVLALESQFEFIWAWGFNVSLFLLNWFQSSALARGCVLASPKCGSLQLKWVVLWPYLNWFRLESEDLKSRHLMQLWTH